MEKNLKDEKKVEKGKIEHTIFMALTGLHSFQFCRGFHKYLVYWSMNKMRLPYAKRLE